VSETRAQVVIVGAGPGGLQSLAENYVGLPLLTGFLT
jgi:hypothetical protein